jgi:hypothetical protein
VEDEGSSVAPATFLLCGPDQCSIDQISTYAVCILSTGTYRLLGPSGVGLGLIFFRKSQAEDRIKFTVSIPTVLKTPSRSTQVKYVYQSSSYCIACCTNSQNTPNVKSPFLSKTIPSTLSGLELPVTALKWPANKTDTEIRRVSDFLGLSFELIYIPVRPQELVFQEIRFGTCEPDDEACG